MIRRPLIASLCVTLAAVALPPTFTGPAINNALKAPYVYSPTDLAGVELFFEADAGVTNASDVTPPADAEGLKGWMDKSGNNRFLLSPGGGTAPTYRTAIQNGKPIIRFAAASSQYLSNTFGSTMDGADLSATITVMCSVVSTNVASALFTLRHSTSTDRQWTWQMSGAAAFQAYKKDDSAAADSVTGFAVIPATFYNFTTVISGTTCDIYTNNVLCVTDTLNVGSTTFNSTWVGRFLTAYSDMDIGAILVRSTAVTAAQRTNDYVYLRRWQ